MDIRKVPEFPMQLPHAQGIRKLRNLAHTVDRAGQLGGIQLQTRHQGWSEAIRRGRFQIGLIGGHDAASSSLERRGHGLHRLSALLIAQAAKCHGRPAHGGSPLQQIRRGIRDAHRGGNSGGGSGGIIPAGR